jgi:hypothetical protein
MKNEDASRSCGEEAFFTRETLVRSGQSPHDFSVRVQTGTLKNREGAQGD